MVYQILAQCFAGREVRIVRHPVGGQKRPGSGQHPIEGMGSEHTGPCAPQYGGGGGPPSSSGFHDRSDLDSTQEFVQRSQYGLRDRKYGRSAREKLRRAGVVAVDLYGEKDNWWFLTVTYPTESIEGCNAISDNSGWIVKSLKNYLRQFEDEKSTFMYCWERQRRGTLHLHFGVRLPHARDRNFCNEGFHRWAVDHLDRLSDRTGINLWIGRWGHDWSSKKSVLQSYAQPVRATLSRYIAKYIGKESSKVCPGWDGLSSPRRWVGVSKDLSDEVKVQTVIVRRCYSTYMSAKNAFSSLIDRLRLVHCKALCFYNVLVDCEGEAFSLFKERRCQRLTSFIKGLGARSMSTSQQSIQISNSQHTELLDSVKALWDWVSVMEGASGGRETTDHFALSSRRLVESVQSGQSCLKGTSQKVKTLLIQSYSEVCRSKYYSRRTTRMRVESSYLRLRWFMHRWQQDPILLIATLRAWMDWRSEEPLLSESSQMNLFDS